MMERSIEYPMGQWSAEGDEILFRPFVPVTIKANGQEFSTGGLIDSGSTISYVDIELAEVLGLDLNKCETTPVGGLGGDGGEGKVATIRVLVDEFEFEYESHVVFTKLHAQMMLLGQIDFFQHFDIHFYTKDCKFIVTKRPTIEYD